MFEAKLFAPGEDLTDAFFVRTEVFVKEQGFSLDLEFDDLDPLSHHVVIYEGEKAAATGRVYPDTETPGTYIIGRIAVMKEYRKSGLGRMIMESLEKKARALGAKRTILGAQCQAQNFYGKLGYTPFGEIYMDEHCPHIYMEKRL